MELSNKKKLEAKQKASNMIAQGQKLKDGDFVCELDNNQRIELEVFTNEQIPSGRNVYYSANTKSLIIDRMEMRSETQYDFPDFKQLCINTFGDGK